MTTNVPRGSGRKAAAAKTAKHAQRTPLPKKAGQQGKGVSAKVVKEEFAARKAGKTTKSVREVQKIEASDKAKHFMEECVRHGWTVAYTREGDTDFVVVTRNDERLHIHWTNNVFQRWAGYTYGDLPEERVVNAKSGLRLIERSKQEATAHAEGRRTRQKVSKSVPKQTRAATSPNPDRVNQSVQFSHGVRSKPGAKRKIRVGGLTVEGADRLAKYLNNEDNNDDVETF